MIKKLTLALDASHFSSRRRANRCPVREFGTLGELEIPTEAPVGVIALGVRLSLVAGHISIRGCLSFIVICSSLLNAEERKVYPYSVVPGGVASDAEARRARASDPLVNGHYSGTATWTETRVMFPTLAYVSLRKGNHILWSGKPVVLPQGELLLTDGKHLLRVRCGNRVVFNRPPPGTDVPPDEPDVTPPDTAFTVPPDQPNVAPPDTAFIAPPDQPNVAPPDTAFIVPNPKVVPPVGDVPGEPEMAPPIASSFSGEQIASGVPPYYPRLNGSGGGVGGYAWPPLYTQPHLLSPPPIVTPEPDTIWLFGLGLLFLSSIKRLSCRQDGHH